jgi:hypothetical protein
MSAPATGTASFRPDEVVLVSGRPGRFRVIAAPCYGALPYVWVRRTGWAARYDRPRRVHAAQLSPAPPEE